MSNEPPFESLSITEQAVLVGVAELAGEDETPVQTHDLRQHCRQQLPEGETEVVGTLSEADVIRALYRLEDEGFVDEVSPAETSPTGKGRPSYRLAVTVESVYDGVSDALRDGTS